MHCVTWLLGGRVTIAFIVFSSSTDVNECELLSSVCGEAQCVNVDGSFLCMCPNGHEYNVMIAKCEPIPTGKPPSALLHIKN